MWEMYYAFVLPEDSLVAVNSSPRLLEHYSKSPNLLVAQDQEKFQKAICEGGLERSFVYSGK